MTQTEPHLSAPHSEAVVEPHSKIGHALGVMDNQPLQEHILSTYNSLRAAADGVSPQLAGTALGPRRA